MEITMIVSIDVLNKDSSIHHYNFNFYPTHSFIPRVGDTIETEMWLKMDNNETINCEVESVQINYETVCTTEKPADIRYITIFLGRFKVSDTTFEQIKVNSKVYGWQIECLY